MSKTKKIRYKTDYKKLMQKVLELAKKGDPSPNPYVGAIITKNKKIIGAGFHKKAGFPHAEIEAINSVKRNYPNSWKKMLNGSELIVNLEPCNHYGRTPPCTKAIVEHKIKKVIFAINDCNKKVKGGGEQYLKKNNIEIEKGILKNKALELNKAYFKVQKTSYPYVSVKLACSLDGKIATKSFDSKWISSEKSRELVKKIRQKVDAILIGANTLRKDNPILGIKKIKTYKKPIRVVVVSKLENKLLNYKLLKENNNLLIAYAKASKKVLENFKKRNIKVLKCPTNKDNLVDLKFLLKELAKLGINHVFCEGGGKITTSLLKEGLVDEMIIFYAPIIIGADGKNMVEKLNIKKIKDAYKFQIKKIKNIDKDIMVILSKN
jgi:diaminohydroxyphosphoribosylaminopyrimidine deaminase/5-amino-6-(5-phosphoribosylamino)uracil reductase